MLDTIDATIPNAEFLPGLEVNDARRCARRFDFTLKNTYYTLDPGERSVGGDIGYP